MIQLENKAPEPRACASRLTAEGAETLEEVAAFAKRRGFVFQGSEIYGGQQGVWDYGHYGALLKDNIKTAWKRSMVQEREDMFLLDGATISHSRVWEASGHVENFSDPLRDCRTCRQRVRADQVEGDRCPSCGGELTEPRRFNLMLSTHLGPVQDTASLAYLRPETAQIIFVQYANYVNSLHPKLPFGIAQVGRAYRNEITPGHFTFRSREFEQMEAEYFVKPGTDEEHHQAWVDARLGWYKSMGIRPENLRVREHGRDELAHYARACVDIEYRFPALGWSELEGIANRADFDLSQHAKFSGQDMSFYEQSTGERFVPYVIEPSAGADRSTLAVLCDAYRKETDGEAVRTVLRLHPMLAPVKVAVLPLARKPRLSKMAAGLAARLRKLWPVAYDETQSIGRRYRRQDEIGTPFCVTVDYESLDDDQVTVRDRDTMSQCRVHATELEAYIEERLSW